MFNKHIQNKGGKIIFSNLSASCIECHKSCLSPNEKILNCKSNPIEVKRRGILHHNNVYIYLCTPEIDYIKSKKKFKAKIESYKEFLLEIEELKLEIQESTNQDVKRLIHNLTSLNAHSIQDLYNLVPQEILTRDFKDQIKIIEKHIQEDIKLSANTFIRIAKSNASMKTEFAVFNKLYETNPILQIKRHTIRKVIFNLLYIFFQDFTDNHIYVEVEENSDFLYFDYESLHVALYHLFENATKYAKHREPIKISFDKQIDLFAVNIEMTSIQITDEDMSNIFKGNYSGVNAKKIGKAGNGLGLNIVQRILNLNNANLDISRNIDISYNTRIYSIPFERNLFRLEFFTN